MHPKHKPQSSHVQGPHRHYRTRCTRLLDVCVFLCSACFTPVPSCRRGGESSDAAVAKERGGEKRIEGQRERERKKRHRSAKKKEKECPPGCFLSSAWLAGNCMALLLLALLSFLFSSSSSSLIPSSFSSSFPSPSPPSVSLSVLSSLSLGLLPRLALPFRKHSPDTLCSLSRLLSPSSAL